MTSLKGIRLQLWIMGTIRATEALAWSSIFPYAYYMIRSFGQVPEADVAFWAGALVAVFTFSEFLSGMVWARVGDAIGRKPTLLIGVVAGISTSVWFGLSRSVAAAVAARAFGGLFNPNVGMVQTCTGELARKEQQAKAFSLVTFIRSLGNLIGPVLGGLLADPVARYPGVFWLDSTWNLWGKFPYLLPNLVIALLQTLTLCVTFLCLRETHPRFASRYDVGLVAGRRVVRMLRWRSAGKDYAYIPLSGSGIDRESQAPEEPERQRSVEETSDDAQTETLDDPVKTPSAQTFTRQIILQVLSLSLLAFHKVSSDSITGTFLALEPSPTGDYQQQGNSTTPSATVYHRSLSLPQAKGGFGFNTQTIGAMFLSEAVVRVVVQATLVPLLVSRLGALRAFRLVLVIYPAAYLLTPFLPGMRVRPPLRLAALLLDLWLKVALSSTGYVCSAILVTNTAPADGTLARINGAAASLSCLARSVGPLLTGKLFAFGLRLGHLEVAFWTLGAVALLGAIESLFLADCP
ncbi:major facilitator superfamily domain-containing protein [Lasiosphaeria ovina]|uniref:Major facilitator superfamily domain-containing protein n=1 Tax=Lasiosphaeria ovina TaxID=92902 RepID=A0AAE0KH19_9PEZI|nr:major facilitator superfamily domain-containing protein [Lasiosphaeria ovina]